MTNDFFGGSTKILTVGELTRTIRSLLEARVGSVWVQGEISNYKKHASGHQYFTLKDSRAQIACVIFRSTMVSLRQPLADGAQVQIYGSITVFESRGQYQLSVEVLQPRGFGLLQAKFEALKRRLEAEGLFDASRKKTLPKFPRRIAIVTSPSGAAIRDILNVLNRRARGIEILINPVRVQGTGAAAEIACAIKELTQPATLWHPLDLIVIARGGGSIEDLWEFNEEIVARAIAASPIPIVSAVGHEIDFTIADFVADLRAPTPSAAAELIVPDGSELDRRVSELATCLKRCMGSFIAHEKTRLGSFSERRLAREPFARIRENRQRLDWLVDQLLRDAQRFLAGGRSRLAEQSATMRRHDPSSGITLRRTRFDQLARRLVTYGAKSAEAMRTRLERTNQLLTLLGPSATLKRGYTITTDAKGRLIKSTKALTRGEMIRTRVSDGSLESKISSVGPN